MQKIKVLSPGKVNLRLDILNKRKDGFHDLRSIMERVSFADELEISLLEKGIELTCNNPDLPLDERNIVYQAAKEILAYSSRNIGVQIHITKNIPISSGLGGGSSNAAAILKGVNALLKLKLSREKLMKIGTKLGADVPFFLLDGPAVAEGIGHELKRIRSMPKLFMILVNPNMPVSTEWVYKNFIIESTEAVKPASVKIPSIFKTKRDVVKLMHNDLERVTTRRYPVVNEIKIALMKLGAMGSQMTGSGPTVFAIYADKVKREAAYDKLISVHGEEWKIFKAENLAA